jgi:hypothetical protein
VVLNQWVDYYDTVKLAWAALTAGPLPDQDDMGLRPAEWCTSRT